MGEVKSNRAWREECENLRKQRDELLAALSAVMKTHDYHTDDGRAPKGWVLVPIEPTLEMKQAADFYSEAVNYKPKGIWYWSNLYQSMLAAAPKHNP